MARITPPSNGSKSQNPTTKFFTWKSNEKTFSYYDRETGMNQLVELPFKFLFLQHYHCVKGWHDASNSSIYSNEVYYIGSEDIRVSASKGGLIAEGLYKEIKPRVVASGGRYHRSIYIVLEDGSLANLSVKGSVVKEWSDYFDSQKNVIDNNWIVVNQFTESKKGSVKYTTPVFNTGDPIGEEMGKAADSAAAYLEAYLKSSIKKDEDNAVVEDFDASEVDLF